MTADTAGRKERRDERLASLRERVGAGGKGASSSSSSSSSSSPQIKQSSSLVGLFARGSIANSNEEPIINTNTNNTSNTPPPVPKTKARPKTSNKGPKKRYTQLFNASSFAFFVDMDSGECTWTLPANNASFSSVVYMSHVAQDEEPTTSLAPADSDSSNSNELSNKQIPKIYFENVKTKAVMWEIDVPLSEMSDRARSHTNLLMKSDLGTCETLIGEMSASGVGGVSYVHSASLELLLALDTWIESGMPDNDEGEGQEANDSSSSASLLQSSSDEEEEEDIGVVEMKNKDADLDDTNAANKLARSLNDMLIANNLPLDDSDDNGTYDHEKEEEEGGGGRGGGGSFAPGVESPDDPLIVINQIFAVPRLMELELASEIRSYAVACLHNIAFRDIASVLSAEEADCESAVQVSLETWVIEGYGCYSTLLVCYFMWSSALGSSCPSIKLYTGGVLYPVG